MRKKIHYKLIILIAMLALTSIAALPGKTHRPFAPPDVKLKHYFHDFNNFRYAGSIPLEQNIYDFLALDDYVYAAYLHGTDSLNLYIGYYYTADKATKAHSPLVCFPAQGWVTTKPQTGMLSIGEHQVNYAVMEAQLGQQSHLIIYWYQAFDLTTTDTYLNKMYVLYNDLFRNDGQSAFVRISIPMQSIGKAEALKIGEQYIRSFYPSFLNFINSIHLS